MDWRRRRRRRRRRLSEWFLRAQGALQHGPDSVRKMDGVGLRGSREDDQLIPLSARCTRPSQQCILGLRPWTYTIPDLVASSTCTTALLCPKRLHHDSLTRVNSIARERCAAWLLALRRTLRTDSYSRCAIQPQTTGRSTFVQLPLHYFPPTARPAPSDAPAQLTSLDRATALTYRLMG